MKKNRSLIISIFITAFLIVIAGGVVTTVLANAQSPATPKISAAEAVKTYQAREAEYQSLLTKANQELDQANQQITQLVNSINSSQDVQNSTDTYPVTAEMAKAIAYQAAGDYPLNEPELVDYNGTVAYEVKFANGNIYVDATTGQILFNGLASPSSQNITAYQAGRLAVAYLGNANVENIEVGTYNGSTVYEIKFTNGQEVYVSLTGKILAVQMPSTSSTSSSSTESESEHESEPGD